MTRFKTMQEFQEFCDTSYTCVCGYMLTGLHERYCKKLRKHFIRLEEKERKENMKEMMK